LSRAWPLERVRAQPIREGFTVMKTEFQRKLIWANSTEI
jgi:hypothetical protein